VSTELDEHRQLLEDARRLDALSRAVAAIIRPGDVVLDVASGTGILGLLACRAGASCVYCVEQAGIIELARQLAHANGFDDRMHFIMAHSSWADVPEQVDAIVCDQIGHFGFEAGIIETLADVRRRCLKPDGRILPAGVTLEVGLVESPALRAELSFWNTPLRGLDVSAGRTLAVNSGHPMWLEPEFLLSHGRPGCRIDLSTMDDAPFGFTTTLTASRDGILDGIGGWFVADLAGDITMTNSPMSPQRLDRRNVLFPIDRPVALRSSDEVRVTMWIRASDSIVHWVVDVRGGEQRFNHSTFAGMLLTREEIKRTDPHRLPHLSARGEARKTVLALCDGGRTLDRIEREVYDRHGNLFRDYAAAQLFVAEVLTRYSA